MPKKMSTQAIAVAAPDGESDTPHPDFFMYTDALKAHDGSEVGCGPTVLPTASMDAV